jgi:hypothetical protein
LFFSSKSHPKNREKMKKIKFFLKVVDLETSNRHEKRIERGQDRERKRRGNFGVQSLLKFALPPKPPYRQWQIGMIARTSSSQEYPSG